MRRSFCAAGSIAGSSSRSFDQKQDAAIFLGSSTGDLPITAAQVEQLVNQRLRSAVIFKRDARVTFDLPAIVQYDSDATLALIEALAAPS